MSSSESTINKIASQNEFEQKAKNFKEVIDLFVGKQGNLISRNTKNAYAFLFKEYDTYLRYQSGCLDLCQFIIDWERNSNNFSKFCNEKYDQELRKVNIDGLNIYESIKKYLEQIKQGKTNISDSNLPLTSQIRFIEKYYEDFVYAVKEKSLKGHAEFIELDTRVLLLGYIRYILNGNKQVQEAHIHHLVNTEFKLDGSTNKSDSTSRIVRFKNFLDTPRPPNEQASIFEQVIQQVVSLSQIDFNASNSGTNFSFLSRVQQAGKKLEEVLANFSELLAIQYNVINKNVDSGVSDNQVWNWCKNELLLSISRLDSPRVYELLRNCDEVDVYGEGIIFEEQIEICHLLDIECAGIVLKETETNEIEFSDLGIDTEVRIKNKGNRLYFNKLVQLASEQRDHLSFLGALREEIESTLVIKTKGNSTKKRGSDKRKYDPFNEITTNESARGEDSPLNEAIKIFKQKTIEQLLVLKHDNDSHLLTPTIILESYFEKGRKRSSFHELYIKYIDQLYGTEQTRYEGKTLPAKEDLKIFVNKLTSTEIPQFKLANNIESFFRSKVNFGQSIKNINAYIKNSDSVPELDEIFEEISDKYTTSFSEIIRNIRNGIEKQSSKNGGESGQSTTFKSIFAYSEKLNPIYSETKDYISLYQVNILLRLLINILFDTKEPCERQLEVLIERSLHEELECSHRVAVHLEFVRNVVTASQKPTVLKNFQRFKHDQIQILKVCVVFNLIYWEEAIDNINLLTVIESLTTQYFEQGRIPPHLKSLLSKNHRIKITTNKSLRKHNIDEFPLLELLDCGKEGHITNGETNFVFSNFAETKLAERGWDPKLVKRALDAGEVFEAAWERKFVFSDDLLFTVLLSDFLDSSSKKDDKKGRNHYKSISTTGGNYVNFVEKITSYGFADWLFPHTEDHQITLKNKLKVLGNIQTFNDERFEIATDNNGLPRKLGQGSFGTVYLCKDKLLETNVAIKLIPTWDDDDERIRKKLISEASIMRRCQGDNIVTVYDIHKFKAESFSFKDDSFEDEQEFLIEDELFGIVMEYIDDARTLHTFVKSPEFVSYSNKKKLGLFIQICRGVEQAHNLIVPVVHGDIKPDNILIDKNGIPKLVDFGVSSYSGSYLGANSGQVYSSPNICEGGKASVQDDIHSLGMVLVYLLYPVIIEVMEKNIDEPKLAEKLVNFCDYLNSKFYELENQFDEFDLPLIYEAEEIILDDLPAGLSLFSNSIKQIFSYDYQMDVGLGWPFGLILKCLEPMLSLTNSKSLLNLNNYECIGSLIFAVGCCKTFGAIAITKNAKYGGFPLTFENYINITERDLYRMLKKGELNLDNLRVFCQVSGHKEAHNAFLGEDTSNGQIFRFSLPHEFFKSDDRYVIEEYYKPHSALIKNLEQLEIFGVNVSLFNKVLKDIKLLSIYPENLQKLMSSSITLNSLDPKKNSKNNSSISLYQPLQEIFDSTISKQLTEAGIKYCEFFMRLPSAALKKIKDCFTAAKNKNDFLNKLTSYDLVDFDKEGVANALYDDDNIFVIKIIQKGKRIDNLELLTIFLELFPTRYYSSGLSNAISNFINSSNIKTLKSDLKRIERFMESDIAYRLVEKCIESQQRIELL